MMNHAEIEALVTLLDDEDKEVLNHVWHKIKSYGKEVVPVLEDYWNPDFNATQSERLESLIKEIRFESLLAEWDEWLNAPTHDLLRAHYLVSSYFFPGLDFEALERKISKIRQSIWIELNNNQTPFEQIQIFNQVLYYHLGFNGDQNASDNVDFCLNHILDSKRGNPISLGFMYIVLARSLNLPMYGVRLKNYFILAFCKSQELDLASEEENEKSVLFYVNAYQKGVIFARNQIDDYLKRMDEKPKNIYYAPSNTIEIVKEILHYLIVINTQKNQEEIVRELKMIKERISR